MSADFYVASASCHQVLVKPLEFKQFGGSGLQIAPTQFGDAIIWSHEEPERWFWKLGDVASGNEATEGVAKTMLWVTYEARILSALVGSGRTLADATKDLLEAKDRGLAEARAELENWIAAERDFNAARGRPSFTDYSTKLASAERQRDEAMAALRDARAVMRNAWGAVTSNQVIDKQVDKMLRRGLDAADAVLQPRALSEVGTGEGLS